MKDFRLFRWFMQLLGINESMRPTPVAAPVVAPGSAQHPPLSESLAELNVAMRTLDGEMLRLAQAWQALGSSLDALKQQKSQAEVEASVFGRIDGNRLN